MSIDVRPIDESEAETWNEYVESSPQGTVFHRFEALQTQATHAGADLRPLVGYKGEEPVGLFPWFAIEKGPVPTAFSPPPGLRVPYLGPATLNASGLKRGKRERRRKRFLDACFDWIRETVAPRYGHVRAGGSVTDVRPFAWNEWSVSPAFTYLVDLAPGREEVLQRFSRDARSNVRNTDPDAYAVSEGGAESVEPIVEQVAQRMASQGVSFDLTPAFVRDCYEALPEGRLRPYTVTVDGSFAGGMLVLDDGDAVARWQGGVRTGIDADVPVNDLLDWHVMADAIERDRTAYDLVGAETPRINEYKAKFNPSLRRYHSLEYSRHGMGLLASLYQRVSAAV